MLFTRHTFVLTLFAFVLSVQATFGETPARQYENRWIFALQYLNTDQELTQTKALIRRAKVAGYNGLAIISGKDYTAADAKFVNSETARAYRAAYTGLEDLRMMDPARVARFKELKRFCDAERFDFIPLVWSVGYCSMQSSDPNFVACWPTKDVPYRVSGGRARFVPGPTPADVSHFNRAYDCAKKGAASEERVKFAVKPCRRYRLATCVKVEGVLKKSVYGGVGPQYGVLAKSCPSGDFSSSHHDNFEQVQDWTESGFTFTTGAEDTEVTLCCRVNSHDIGTIRIRDAKLYELGVEYPVCRAGTRFEVKDAKTGKVYREGVDYARVPAVDLICPDERKAPLELEILEKGAIAEGAELLVSAWEPKSVYDTQYTACFTNPALKEYYKRSAKDLARELGVTKWFMSADEIRVGCRCERCLRDPDVSGVRIGKDYRAQYDAIRAACPSADIFMWPDMANINHNATDNYYLMGTTTKGALDYIPKDVTLVSWWGYKAPINLPYYASRGYRTIGAGFYDKRTAEATRKSADQWRPYLDETPNCRGFMYTTWLYGIGTNFAFLEDFIDAYKTAVPYEPTKNGELPKKLMTFNVCSGHGDKPRYGIPKDDPVAHLEECAAVIRREKPDWCAIQEVDMLADRSAKIDQAHELARRTGMFPVFGQTIKHKGGQGAGAYGVMTLSREKPLRYSAVPLKDETEDRVLLITEYDKYIAVATHLSLHAEDALAAAKLVNRKFANSEKPVFFAGDLNSTADSPAIEELKKNFVALTDGKTPTFPTDAPKGEEAMAIDWIFVDKPHAAMFAGFRAAVLPDAKPSDHFPVTVSFGAPAKLYEDRWAYSSLPLNSEKDLPAYADLIARLQRCNMNGLALSIGLDLAWTWSPAHKEVFRKFRAMCDAAKIDIIPLIWTTGYGTMTWADSELIESEPVYGAPFVARGDLAVFEPDQIAFKNADLEEFDAAKNRFAQWVTDDAGVQSFVDTEMKHSGKASLRYDVEKCANKYAHARLCQKVAVKPGRRYRFSAWVRAKDLQPACGPFRLQAYLEGMSENGGAAAAKSVNNLQFEDGWWHMSVEFAAGSATNAFFYVGTWGAKKGSFWIDDCSVEEIGYPTLIAGEKYPFVVKNENTGEVYKEGRDWKRPTKGSVKKGGFMSIPIVRGGAIREGDRIVVDAYAPSRHGPKSQISTCMSHPKLYELLEKSAQGIMEVCAPKKWFLSVDEVRNGNTCPLCRARKTDMAHIFGDCVTRMCKIIRKHRPDADIYAWSDMFDPNHNCGDNYYGCKGTFSGVIDLIPNDIIMSCWYRARRDLTVPYFTSKGFRVQAGAYYDSNDPKVDAGWMETLNRTPGATGWMYTTWQRKYKVLEEYARFMNEQSKPRPIR